MTRRRVLLVAGGMFIMNLSAVFGLVPRFDNFDGDSLSAMWKVFLDDPRNILTEQTNSRLEVTSTDLADEVDALVVSNAWSICTSDDFKIKADLYHSAVTNNWSEVYFGVGYRDDPLHYDEDYIEIALGCDFHDPGYWYERGAGDVELDTDWIARYSSDATLYISYDASLDKLYLSSTGYGPQNAWKTVTGVIKGDWNRATVKVGLGGYSEGVPLASGRARLDNLVIDQATLCEVFLPADVNEDCKVDLADFAMIAESWLACNLDPQSACPQ